MKYTKTAAVLSALGLVFGWGGGGILPVRAEEKPLGQAPQIEVCFVLDTTGSMGGLIEGAKQKIWSIANQIIAPKPTPKLKVGLIAYRDRGDEYVTRVFDLSDDMDAVYAHLQKFGAAGGGDGPESVNQALGEAVDKMSWSTHKSVLKLVFLVGDYPPHMDYANDVKYQQTCQTAVRKDLIINTVQCGNIAETTRVWQEIARLGEGKYVGIGQTGDMEIVSTPLDKDLAELNSELSRTVVVYGSADMQSGVRSKQALAESMPMAAAADRLAYNVSTGKAVQGTGDLVGDLAEGKVKLEALKEDELPQDLKGKSREEQQKYLNGQMAKRREIQGKVDGLLKKRQDYIDQQKKARAGAGHGTAFDAEVLEMLRFEAGRKGIKY